MPIVNAHFWLRLLAYATRGGIQAPSQIPAEISGFFVYILYFKYFYLHCIYLIRDLTGKILCQKMYHIGHIYIFFYSFFSDVKLTFHWLKISESTKDRYRFLNTSYFQDVWLDLLDKENPGQTMKMNKSLIMIMA